MTKLKRRIDTADKARTVKSTNQGASCFTDFFDERNEFNENPAGPFNELVENSDVDLMGRKLKK